MLPGRYASRSAPARLATLRFPRHRNLPSASKGIPAPEDRVLLGVDTNDATAAKEAGVGFIHKGASPDELIATLTPLLRKE